MWCITLIDLQILNQPCSPGMSPTWSCWIILFICCWIRFASILLRIFASIFIRDIGLSFFFFFFFCWVSVWFGNQSNAGFIEWVWKFSFPFYFLAQVEKDRYYLYFKCLVEFPREAIWSWTANIILNGEKLRAFPWDQEHDRDVHSHRCCLTWYWKF